MLSVSGKNWEEEKISKRLFEKIKVDYNFENLTINQILSKKFSRDEILSLENNLQLANPFIKKSDFIEGVNLLDNSIKNNKNICIIGDYDVDGCLSASLLVRFFKEIKARHYFYIPNRFIDGYGSTRDLIKKIIIKKPDLVIMVDNGSSSNDAINYLNKHNIKSIIIDHHEIYKPYPKSDIIINPKKNSDYKNFDYFSSGVLTYFFIDCYIKHKKIRMDFSENLYLVLLTIVSDVMPLRKINRLIANKVLNKNNTNQKYFLKKIFNIKKLNKPVDIDDFGFLFGPIINSAGRLEDPNTVVQLFTSNNSILKDKLINKLVLLNEKRKRIENDIFKRINLKEISLDNSPIIIYEDSSINEGLIGLIASRFKTYFDKPSIVITRSGNNNYKGSARSTQNFPIGKLIKSALDIKLLESGGGHNLAAGFTIKKKNLNRFKQYLKNVSKKKFISISYKFLSKVSLNSLNKNFLSDLNKLQPFGEDNLNPYFLIENIKIFNIKVIKDKFISCMVKSRSGKTLSAISFNFFDSDLSKNILYNKNEVNIIVQVKENFWNNNKNLQLIIIDIIKTSNKA